MAPQLRFPNQTTADQFFDEEQLERTEARHGDCADGVKALKENTSPGTNRDRAAQTFAGSRNACAASERDRCVFFVLRRRAWSRWRALMPRCDCGRYWYGFATDDSASQHLALRVTTSKPGRAPRTAICRDRRRPWHRRTRRLRRPTTGETWWPVSRHRAQSRRC